MRDIQTQVRRQGKVNSEANSESNTGVDTWELPKKYMRGNVKKVINKNRSKRKT